MSVVTRQSMSDDSGTKTDGTVVSKAFVDQVYGEVDDQCHSTTNPTVKPKATTDEVIAARGVSANLDARLDAIDSTISAAVSVAQVAGGLGGVNLIANDDFQLWPAGDAVAPFGWVSSGAGVATIARVGTGLSDISRKVGDFAFRWTVTDNAKTLEYVLVPPGSSFVQINFVAGSYFLVFGAWVLSDGAHVLTVSDGAASTNSVPHTGSSLWEFLTVSHPINASATKLTVQLNKSGTATKFAYLSGATAMLLPQSYVLQTYQPCPVGTGEFGFIVAGTLAVTAGAVTILPPGPGIVRNVNVHAGTAPTGAAILIDVNAGDPTAPTSMFGATKVTIAATTKFGALAPDGIYANRCLRHPNIFSNVLGAAETGGLITVDIDQIGSGVAGANLDGYIRVLAYNSPIRHFLTSIEI